LILSKLTAKILQLMLFATLRNIFITNSKIEKVYAAK